MLLQIQPHPVVGLSVLMGASTATAVAALRRHTVRAHDRATWWLRQHNPETTLSSLAAAVVAQSRPRLQKVLTAFRTSSGQVTLSSGLQTKAWTLQHCLALAGVTLAVDAEQTVEWSSGLVECCFWQREDTDLEHYCCGQITVMFLVQCVSKIRNIVSFDPVATSLFLVTPTSQHVTELQAPVDVLRAQLCSRAIASQARRLLQLLVQSLQDSQHAQVQVPEQCTAAPSHWGHDTVAASFGPLLRCAGCLLTRVITAAPLRRLRSGGGCSCGGGVRGGWRGGQELELQTGKRERWQTQQFPVRAASFCVMDEVEYPQQLAKLVPTQHKMWPQLRLKVIRHMTMRRSDLKDWQKSQIASKDGRTDAGAWKSR